MNSIILFLFIPVAFVFILFTNFFLRKNKKDKILLEKIELNEEGLNFFFDIKDDKYSDFYIYLTDPFSYDKYYGKFDHFKNSFHPSVIVIKPNNQAYKELCENPYLSYMIVIHCLYKNYKKEYRIRQHEIDGKKFWDILKV